MRVELDIFCGRPNPSWKLLPSEAAELVQRLRAAPPTDTPPPAGGGLGYRGLIVTPTAGASIDSCAVVAVSKGVISCQRPSGDQLRRDPGRALERWLLGTGKAHIDPDLYEEVVRSL